MVYILLAPGFEEIEALAPVDLLRRANIETATVSITGEPVPGSHGVTVTADIALEDVDLSRADMVVLPGGGPGYKNLGKDPRVEQLVRAAVEKDIWVAAICAAPTLLGRWGLLEGKKAICYPGMEEGLTGAQPRMDQGVVVAGKVITGRAAGSAFDFGLTLVETLAGKEESDKVRHGIYY